MRKLFITILTFLFFTTAQVFAYNTKLFTNDTKIAAALEVLEQSNEHGVFANLKRNAVKIKFDALPYSNVYAANMYDNYGRRIIVINTTYKNAPVEQIACLIAHESCHVARKATLEEETTATSKEAACWIKLKKAGVTYPETKLTKRLDKLAGLHFASAQDGNDYIEDKIASSSFYKAQFNL